MQETKPNAMNPDAVRNLPEEVLCPSCGKFVGAYEKCPYCGTELKKRMSIIFFKRAALVLALGGLFLLWFTATKMQPPLIHIADINPRYNNAVVEVRGVAEDVRTKGKDRIDFVVDDGTDTLKVQAFRGLAEMRKAGNVPRTGDRVIVVGSIQMTDKYGTSMMINVPSKVKVIPATTEKVSIGDIRREDKGKLVEVVGEIVTARRSRGDVFLAVGDTTGIIEVPLFKRDLVSVKDVDAISTEGKEIRVIGKVDEYRGKAQIRVRDAQEISVQSGDAIPAKKIPGYDEAKRKQKEIMQKESPAMRKAESYSDDQAVGPY